MILVVLKVHLYTYVAKIASVGPCRKLLNAMKPKRKKVRPKADQGIGLWHGREELYSAAVTEAGRSRVRQSMRRSSASPLASKRWQSAAMMPVTIGCSARTGAEPGRSAQ